MAKRITKKELVEKIHELYGDAYILDEIDYINKQTKIKLVCPKHGEFYVTPKHLLNGHACKKCSYEKMGYGVKEFEKRARKVHGDKYTYVEYKNARTPCTIICPIHGEFKQNPSTHLLGSGCPKCANYRGAQNTKEWFVEKARKVHGDKYDYSKVKYINSNTEVCIICPTHGEFWQTPKQHLTTKGCRGCKRGEDYRTSESFIKKAKEIHGNKYDYSKVEYADAKTKVCIICPKHGEFWQIPYDHLNGHGCQSCNESKLEKEINDYLESSNIQHSREQRFKWLGQQRLDFYLPQYNIAIECQGIQHYEPISFTNDKSKTTVNKNFKMISKRDQRKKKLCEENGVKLLYYTNYKDIEEDNEITFKDKEKLLKHINENNFTR